MKRPSLLLMTAAIAAIAAIANGVSATSPEGDQDAQQTRLGSAIGQDLNKRDASAAKRKRALDLREKTVKAAEARLKAELEAKQKAEEAGAKPSADTAEPEAQYEDLARIYQAMKPAKAAIVFEQLSMEVQVKVAKRMRERSTAMILAAMTPKGAAALSMALARGNAPPELPEFAR